jgi:hypothetical protein
MILVWRGWGLLCILIPGGLIVAAEAVAGERLFQQYTNLFWAVVLLISAGILWLVGQRLNRTPGRVLVDPQTGEQVVLRKTHSFFFVRMEYWAIAFAVCGAVVLVVTLVSALVH